MKLVSGLPSDLARATDVVDRAIVSNIDIHQEAMFPLESLPLPWLAKLSTSIVDPQRQSFSLANGVTVANGGGASLIDVFLGRGLWRLTCNNFYTANYVSTLFTGLQIDLGPNSPGPTNLVLQPPFVGSAVWTFSAKFLLIDDLQRFQVLLGPNGVGQSQTAVVSLTAEKYF